MNTNKEWNPDDWQGRSREQVEFSEGVCAISFFLILLMGLLYAAYQLF